MIKKQKTMKTQVKKLESILKDVENKQLKEIVKYRNGAQNSDIICKYSDIISLLSQTILKAREM